MLEKIEIYILLFFTYSFAGWFMESFGGIFKEKKLINRGFLIGPYCPVYGVGVIAITILLSKYTNDLPVLFILCILICGVLEYSTSYIMEKQFHARWWDYSNKKFNINGRICLETLLPFGIVGTLIIYYANPFFENIYISIPANLLNIITAVLSILFIIDIIVSFSIISSFKGEIFASKDNTEEISNKVKDKTEEIGNKVKDKTEEALEKAEEDFKLFGKELKLRRIHFEEKAKYTRSRISNAIIESPKELAERINRKRELINNAIKNKADAIADELKEKREDITKIVKENFKKKSILKKRLMEAFPKLEIKIRKE